MSFSIVRLHGATRAQLCATTPQTSRNVARSKLALRQRASGRAPEESKSEQQRSQRRGANGEKATGQGLLGEVPVALEADFQFLLKSAPKLLEELMKVAVRPRPPFG